METDLYTEASEILRKAREKRATLKTLIYASKYKNIRRLFALVNECHKHRDIIEEVLSHCSYDSIVAELAGGSSEMAQVLLYEYLLGHKFGRTGSMRKLIQRYKNEISSSVEKVLEKHQAKTLSQAAQKVGEKTLIKIPRYMRVNLIKSRTEDAVAELVSEGWSYFGKMDMDKFPDQAKSLDKWQFGLDPLLFDLLVFPSGTDLHEHPLTKSGVLVQQDRASCVPAHVLSPTRDSVVLDCCSAPGNKTSHLASLIGDTGRVIALDRDHKRMSTMSRLLESSGATCVEMIVQDFLTVRPDSDDAQDIQLILVDPSCSGSGMRGSGTEQPGSSNDSQRLQMLKRFQISILKHALRFPAVERVVYSTCSIHEEENEQVVEEVMAQVSQHFQFRPAFPEWKNSRGMDGYHFSHSFLRLSPERDLTQGFFVACFERVRQQLGLSVKSEVSQDDDQLWGSGELESVTSQIQVASEYGANVKSESGVRVKSKSGANVKSESGVRVKSKSGASVKSESSVRVKSKSGANVKSESSVRVKSKSGASVKSERGVYMKSESCVQAKSRNKQQLKCDKQTELAESNSCKRLDHECTQLDQACTQQNDSHSSDKKKRRKRKHSQEPVNL